MSNKTANADLGPNGHRCAGVPYTLLRCSEGTADWDEFLKNVNFVEWVCPVDFFPNAPFASIWKDFAKTGTKVEVPHPQYHGNLKVNCVATVKAFAGYKALIEFERTDDGPSILAWMTFCSDVPKPLGHSISSNILILPVVPDVGDELPLAQLNEKLCQFIGQSSSNAESTTISNNHREIVRQELENMQGQTAINQVLEVIDTEKPIRNRLANVTHIVGDRIKIRYVDGSETDPGFCVNVNSELVHPLGWSHAVGQSLKGFQRERFTFPRVSKNSFPKYPDEVKITDRMVFEVRHPRRPYSFACARVKRKLGFGYFEAIILGSDMIEEDEFVFHITSDYIMPINFCGKHNIPLDTPYFGGSEKFCWEEFLATNEFVPLYLYKLPKRPKHNFVKGCKLEAVDACQPLYYGPATVLNVVEHLLFLHFDGWPRDKLDCIQWVSAFSPDIYPAGWAEMVGHSFQSHAEAPRPNDSWFIDGNNYLPLLS